MISKDITIAQISHDKRERLNDEIVREIPLTIVVNGKELVTLQCSPGKLEYLAGGFLFSEGLVRKRMHIKHINLNERGWYIRIDVEGDVPGESNGASKRVITSGCAGGITFYRGIDAEDCFPLNTRIQVSHKRISNLMKQLQEKSSTFKNTGGVHSCALCTHEGIEIFAEDIGRHNAVDKIFGECLMRGISTEGKIILTSGRVSSEILIKVAKRKVPFIVSRSAPTDLAVNLAEKFNVTLVGFARGRRMNIYTHNYRVI